MNKKEAAEIKKNLASCISRIAVCYVNADRETVISYVRSPGVIPEEIMDDYVVIFKKALTGKVDKVLLNLEFPEEEEEEGGKQALLMDIVRDAMEDSHLLEAYYERAVQAFDIAGNFLILSACGAYDVPMKTSDGSTYDDMGEDVYSFFISAICPVEPVSPGLCYGTDKKDFVEKIQDWVVKKPEAAFLFPSFTDRMSNIHECFYYMKKQSQPHEEFAAGVLGCSLPDSADSQKARFTELLSEALGKEANVSLLADINRNISEFATEKDVDGQPCDINTQELNHILRISGTEKEITEDIQVKSTNIAEDKYIFEGDGVKITVSQDKIGSVIQKMDGGAMYLMVPASGLIMNGVPVRTG